MRQPHETWLVLRREALNGMDFEAETWPLLAGLHARHPAFQHDRARRFSHHRCIDQTGTHGTRRESCDDPETSHHQHIKEAPRH